MNGVETNDPTSTAEQPLKAGQQLKSLGIGGRLNVKCISLVSHPRPRLYCCKNTKVV